VWSQCGAAGSISRSHPNNTLSASFHGPLVCTLQPADGMGQWSIKNYTLH